MLQQNIPVHFQGIVEFSNNVIFNSKNYQRKTRQFATGFFIKRSYLSFSKYVSPHRRQRRRLPSLLRSWWGADGWFSSVRDR